jgi:hypothetical protein
MKLNMTAEKGEWQLPYMEVEQCGAWPWREHIVEFLLFDKTGYSNHIITFGLQG